MIKKFLEYNLYTRGLSINTIIKERKGLKKFGLYLEKIGKDLEHPEEITLEDVFAFITSMREAGLVPGSCNAVIDGIKAYFYYLRNILDRNVLDSKKICYCKEVDRDIGFYDDKQKYLIKNLINKGVGNREITQLRNRVLTYMLLHTGLRCHELAKVKVEEIGENLRVLGKGGKLRTVYLRPELLEMIGEYLSKRPKESEWLFPATTKGHIREGSIRTIFNKMSRTLGFRIHSHKFRHTFATDLLHIPGSSIYDVAKLMGHSSTRTTEIYLGTTSDTLKKLQFGLSL